MEHLVDSRLKKFLRIMIEKFLRILTITFFFNSRGGGCYLTQAPAAAAAAALLFARHATLPSQMINHHLIISVLGKAGTRQAM